MKNKLEIDPNTILNSSTEFSCPNENCDSTLFFPTMKVRKVSALMTGTGKAGIIPISGPMLCVKCHRELTDTDFGYKKEDSPEIIQTNEENTG